MAKRNPLENNRISERFKASLERARNSTIVPFGEEEVSPAEFRSRFANMSEFERKQVLNRNGQAEIIRQLRGG